MEDKLLIWRFKRGRRDALRRIYDKYHGRLLKLAVALTNDINTAEDAVQDVFVSFAQSAARVGLAGNLKTYLATCVANRIRNAVRDRQRHEAAGIEDAECIICDAKRPEQWAILSEEMELLSNALAQIPYEQREAVLLHVKGEMKLRNIAKLQGVTVSTVHGRYRYGLDKLRSLLNSEVE